MKDNLFYQSYNGNDPYLFLMYDKADRLPAHGIINHLIDREFRTCYHEQDRGSLSDPEWLAERILGSGLAVFLLSADSMESLSFRNCINFALSRKKAVFCIVLDIDKLEYGFDMQLAAVPSVRFGDYPSIIEFCEGLLKTGCFVQDLRGEDARTIRKSDRKKKVALGIMAASLILFFTSATAITIDRIRYENSFAGQIEDLSETDYLDITGQDASTIEMLEGKTIKTLIARQMNLTDIQGLESVVCEVLDLSQNPKINTLEPLLNNKHLKTVKVTQDMLPAIARISGRHPFTIIITG